MRSRNAPRELGIRLALGAQPGDVLRIVLGQGARLAAAGLAMGIVVSLALTRVMATLLFGVGARDPITLVGVGALLALVSVVACYIPTRRAMRVDPVVAFGCNIARAGSADVFSACLRFSCCSRISQRVFDRWAEIYETGHCPS